MPCVLQRCTVRAGSSRIAQALLWRALAVPATRHERVVWRTTAALRLSGTMTPGTPPKYSNAATCRRIQVATFWSKTSSQKLRRLKPRVITKSQLLRSTPRSGS
jgi:hypothetical protein